MSVKALEEKVEIPKEAEEDLGDVPTAMELALRQAMQGTEMGAELMTAPRPGRGNGRKGDGKKQDKRRQQQSDIFARTLQNRPK